MTPERLIAMVKLKDDGRIHLVLPASCAQLAVELRAQKEQVRAILRDRQNATRPRKAPRQAAPQQPPEPTYIAPACICDACRLPTGNGSVFSQPTNGNSESGGKADGFRAADSGDELD